MEIFIQSISYFKYFEKTYLKSLEQNEKVLNKSKRKIHRTKKTNKELHKTGE